MTTATQAIPFRSDGDRRVRRLATSGIVWGLAVSAAMATWVWLGLGGREYYLTPLRVRAYAPGHVLLRPSGPVGQTLGVVGTVLLIVPFVYMARKRLRLLRRAGSVGGWLEVHLFCGIAGPVLITLHTSFKFNGIISAAYWSMVIVMLSGFVGRFLYVRIPRSIRGIELTRGEVDAEADRLRLHLIDSGIGGDAIQHIDAFDHDTVPPGQGLSLGRLIAGEFAIRMKRRRLHHELRACGVPHAMRIDAVRLATNRALLLHRAACLQQTKRFFSLWHVFHLPLVYLLLVIAAAHIGLVLYMGYVPFRW